MSATAHPCYVCKDAIEREPGKPAMAATFQSELREVCSDCGKGIRDGNEIMLRNRVSGEYLGPCGDNDQPGEP